MSRPHATDRSDPRLFVKTYRDPARSTAAARHHTWLQQVGSGIRLPRLIDGRPDRLTFERLPGRHARPDDLEHIAAALGRLHGVAHAAELHAARLDAPHTTRQGLVLPGFLTARRRALAEAQPSRWDVLPVAFYKDANPRNFLITDNNGTAEVAVLDFDDLTLAPFGYDLAKLVVTTAMTHGGPDHDLIAAALRSYNDALRATAPRVTPCRFTELSHYAEMHHHLTAPYLGSGGYVHLWPDVRPWPRPPGWPAP
jgi:hypothetical protein